MTVSLPQLEGKYEILAKLREGGMGAIYKVRHRLLDEIRVIKMMKSQLEEDAELSERFLREARNAIRLRHPNIAQLYDFSVDENGTRFMVIEYIDGLSLQEVIDHGEQLPLHLAVEIALQALRALNYLHRQGFVHRDISPDNLMLTSDFDQRPLVKLIDLGIAKAVESKSTLTKADTFLGKVRYAAPENFHKGSDKVDARSDIYSFGIVFYQLLTNEFPISGKDVSSFIAGHLFQPVRPFDETDREGRIPDALRQIVLKALAKKPSERMPDASTFIDQVAKLQLHRSGDLVGATAHLLALRAGGSETSRGSTPAQGRVDEVFPPLPTPPPPPRGTLEMLLDAARAAMDSQDFSLARAKLDQAAQLDPGAELVDELRREVETRETARRRELDLVEARRLLHEGRLDDARSLATELRRRHPEDRRAEELLKSIERRAAELSSRARVDEARRLAESGDLVAAIQLLAEALELWDGNREALALRTDLERRLDEQLAAEAMEKRVAEAQAEARALFAQQDWEAARGYLVELQSEVGERPEIYALWDEFAEREQQHRDALYSEQLDRARELAEAGDLDEAIRQTQDAARLAPSDSRRGERQLEELRARWEEARRLEMAAEAERELNAQVEEAIANGDFVAARGAVTAAGLGVLAGEAVLSTQLERIAEVEGLTERAGPVLDQAERLLMEGQLDRAAIELDRLEGVLLPKTVQDRRERALAEWRRLSGVAALESRIDAIEERLEAGDFTSARAALEAAVEEFGPEPLAGFRERIDRREAELREEQRGQLVEAGRTALEAGELDVAVRHLGKARDLDPEDTAVVELYRSARGAAEAERERASREAAIRLEVEEIQKLRRQERYRQALRELERVEQEYAAREELASLRAQLEEERSQHRFPSWVLIAAAVGAGILLVVLAIVFLGGSEDVAPEPLPGTVVITAEPWARVVDVVAADGTSRLDRAEAYTPLVLELAAGSYSMTLRGPGGEETVAQLTIEPSGRAEVSHTFRPGDVDDLFARLGWPSP